ncbi:MAG TPA: hypothetical protein ENG51_03710 [Deltaproteobacteria bacterium]|nr:hypothetical protein [Deltaproteobacteria bacterium]
MSISITSAEFALFLGLSIVIAVLYYVGYKRNMKTIEAVSKSLENSLKPSDKEYTWLGGVLGFTGNYTIEGFEKVTASVFMLPRQSILYFPFSYITTGYDRVEVLFFLKNKVWNEVHVIRDIKPSYQMPKIFNAHLLKTEKLTINEKPFVVMYRNKTGEVDSIISLGQSLEPLGIMHIALTPEKRVLYVRLKIKPKSVSEIEDAMKTCLSYSEHMKSNNTDN